MMLYALSDQKLIEKDYTRRGNEPKINALYKAFDNKKRHLFPLMYLIMYNWKNFTAII